MVVISVYVHTYRVLRAVPDVRAIYVTYFYLIIILYYPRDDEYQGRQKSHFLQEGLWEMSSLLCKRLSFSTQVAYQALYIR